MTDLPTDLMSYILGKVDPVEHLRGLVSRVDDLEGLKPFAQVLFDRLRELQRAPYDHWRVGDVVRSRWGFDYTIMHKGVMIISLRFEGRFDKPLPWPRKYQDTHYYESMSDYTLVPGVKYGRVRRRTRPFDEPSPYPSDWRYARVAPGSL